MYGGDFSKRGTMKLNMKLEKFMNWFFRQYFDEAKWGQIKNQERANPLRFNLKKIIGILFYVTVYVIFIILPLVVILWRIFNK